MMRTFTFMAQGLGVTEAELNDDRHTLHCLANQHDASHNLQLPRLSTEQVLLIITRCCTSVV